MYLQYINKMYITLTLNNVGNHKNVIEIKYEYTKN